MKRCALVSREGAKARRGFLVSLSPIYHLLSAARSALGSREAAKAPRGSLVSLSPICYFLSAFRSRRLPAAGYRNFLNPISYLLTPARLGLLALTVLAATGWGQSTIVGWDFNGLSNYGSSPQAPGTTAANVTATGLARSGLGTGGTAASNAWGGTGNGSASFTVKANTGYTLSLTQISAYNVRRSSSGATTGQWAYSLDGSAFVNIGSAIAWGNVTSGTGGNPQTDISLSGISALQNLSSTTTVTFRVTLTGASSGSGTWYLNNLSTAGDDFVVTGTVTAAATAPSTQATSFTSSSVTSSFLS